MIFVILYLYHLHLFDLELQLNLSHLAHPFLQQVLVAQLVQLVLVVQPLLALL